MKHLHIHATPPLCKFGIIQAWGTTSSTGREWDLLRFPVCIISIHFLWARSHVIDMKWCYKYCWSNETDARLDRLNLHKLYGTTKYFGGGVSSATYVRTGSLFNQVFPGATVVQKKRVSSIWRVSKLPTRKSKDATSSLWDDSHRMNWNITPQQKNISNRQERTRAILVLAENGNLMKNDASSLQVTVQQQRNKEDGHTKGHKKVFSDAT